MFFVSLAIYLLWRSAAAPDFKSGISNLKSSPSPLAAPRWPLLYYHLAAAATGLAFDAKQGGLVYPLVFLVLYAAVERRWRWLGRFVLSGAPVTLGVFALPWYATTIAMIGFETFRKEISDVAGGRDHPGSAVLYVPWLLKATAPWCGLLVLAIVQAVRRFRDEPAARGLVLWIAAILLPLCFAGNKQDHYLLPAIPPAMLLTAWLVARIPVSRYTDDTRLFDPIGIATVITLALVGVAVPVIAHRARGDVRPPDIFVSVALVLLAVLTLALWRRQGRSALALPILLLPAVMPGLLGRWMPSLARQDHRTLAAVIRAGAGPGPYCFYGPNESFPLIFTLQSIIPQYGTEDALRSALSREPRLIVIAQTKNRTNPPPVPEGLSQVVEQRMEDQVVRVYRRCSFAPKLGFLRAKFRRTPRAHSKPGHPAGFFNARSNVDQTAASAA
jgi:4-amino-4-deoxy-L-arabinose transferase-like glycosyltransferase